MDDFLQDSFERHDDIDNAPRHSEYVEFAENGLYADEALRLYDAHNIGLALPIDDPDFLAGNIFYGPNITPDLLGFKRAIRETDSRDFGNECQRHDRMHL